MRYVIIISIYVIVLFLLYVPITFPVNYEQDEGFVEAFFCQEVDCGKLIVDLIDASNNSYCALYDLDEPNIIAAIERNNINVLLFEENYEEEIFSENILPVGSAGLMHHKFCVFDEKYVIAGSWNPTERGMNKNDNYALFFSSEKIADSFLEEYDYLQTRENLPDILNVNLSRVPISLYFCPLHNCEMNVLETLALAEESIEVLAFSFTSEPIAKMLVNKSLQGVNVSVIFEKTRITSYSRYEFLLEHNISVFKDGNSYTMHEKLFIIDGEVIIAGSYNPTASANTKNDENILIIENEILANQFQKEFLRVKNISKQ